MSLKGRRFHYEGKDEDGTELFTECAAAPDDVNRLVVRGVRAEPGEPVKLGERLVSILPDGEHHYVMDEVSGDSKGPPRVVSDRYRDGWNRIFGKNGIN